MRLFLFNNSDQLGLIDSVKFVKELYNPKTWISDKDMDMDPENKHSISLFSIKRNSQLYFWKDNELQNATYYLAKYKLIINLN